MRARRAAITCCAALIGAAAVAETDLTLLTPPERAALGAEIRATVLANPELVQPALAPPPPAFYEDEINADLARIRAEAAQLFAPGHTAFGLSKNPVAIAFFTRANCPACAQAEADLRALAETSPIRVAMFDMSGPDAALAARLELDTAPSYVFETMMIRGHMPPIVLQKYIDKAAKP
ncbi:hypothetical protein [Thalassovita taeanensis]|uniref:Uncharacterized protein n=1 Tax=Thalassovita taeanensis TaxID=657014 RepID=A0A1H8YSI3_9RHOB|nr:hypothetical protein [Thalassovita taeanensis]SEP54981.1 hypothetical protein SAMN04488092_10135 [Thalassovita taeanensis]